MCFKKILVCCTYGTLKVKLFLLALLYILMWYHFNQPILLIIFCGKYIRVIKLHKCWVDGNSRKLHFVLIFYKMYSQKNKKTKISVSKNATRLKSYNSPKKMYNMMRWTTNAKMYSVICQTQTLRKKILWKRI